jgi:hypothetical protein
MRKRQSGVSLFVVALVLVLAAGLVAALGALFRSRSNSAGSAQTIAAFAALQTALEQYAGATGRLPCPANPALDTGIASPAVASAACDFPAGTIPWSTIGARRDDAYDPWGGKISYRVYTGGAGSLTQDNGASMVQCDLTVGSSPGTIATGRCQQHNGWHTAAAEFLIGKGLNVTDFGNPNVVAYVLISHGSSGLGAWTSGGTQRTMPTSVDELANTTASGPFVAKAAADDADPASATHFDDVLAYRTIPELARRANLAAREWSDPTTESAVLNTNAIRQLTGSTPNNGDDLGRQTLELSNSSITAFDSSGNQNLSFQDDGTAQGVGGVTSGGGIGSQDGEGIRISLAVKARLLGMTLNDFVTSPSAFPFWKAQVQVTFIDSTATPVISATVVKTACRAGSGLASFSKIDAGFDFDTIEIRATDSAPDPFFGSQVPSTFFLSAFSTCAAGAASCSTTLESAANVCP